jgi:hypothetical protein
MTEPVSQTTHVTTLWDTDVIRLTVQANGTLFIVTADEPRGLMAVGQSLAEALAGVPAALAELREVGAPMPRLRGVTLP